MFLRRCLFLLACCLVVTSSHATFQCNGRRWKNLCHRLSRRGLPKPKCCAKFTAPSTAPVKGPSVPTAPTPAAPAALPTQFFKNGKVLGDPHLVTFDNVFYSCQAKGEFTLFRALRSGAHVQTRFEKISQVASLTTGVAARESTTSPLFQLSIPKTGPDAVHMYVDRVRISNPFGGFNNQVLQVSVTSNLFTVLFKGTGLTLLVRLVQYIEYSHLDVTVRLPRSFRNETIVGLLGSPDDNPTNDWMSPNGTKLVLPKGNVTQLSGYDYCTKQWCNANTSTSLFTYEGISTFSYYYGCNETYPGDASIGTGNQLRVLCGRNLPCIIDGVQMGSQGAQNVLNAEAEFSQLSSEARLTAWPNMLTVNQIANVALTVNLTSFDTTGIEGFKVYRVNGTTREVGSKSIVTLRDVGSGIGNDTVAGDKVFSNVIAMQPEFAGESFGFYAIPTTRGSPPLAALDYNLVRSYSVESGIGDYGVVPEYQFNVNSIEGLVLVVQYTWPADKADLNTGTFFLGTATGFECCPFNECATYMDYLDESASAAKETTHVLLGKSYKDGMWFANNTSTTVDMKAGWYDYPHDGPATLTISTYYNYGNGTITARDNVHSMAFYPGIHSGCVKTNVARVRIVRLASGIVDFRISIL